MAFALPEIGQAGMQPFPYNPSCAQPDLVDSVRRACVSTIAKIVNHEDTHSMKSLEYLAGGLFHQVRRNHRQRGEAPATAVNINCTKGHLRLAGTHLPNNGRRVPLLPAPSNTHNRHALRWKW